MSASKLLRPAKYLVSTTRQYRVTVLGGASTLGQTVCMLMRSEPGITQLNVWDSSPTLPGFVKDLSYIPADNKLKGITEERDLVRTLSETDIILTTNKFHENSQTSTNNLEANAVFIQNMANHVSRIRPMPFVGIATEPIHILVPLAAEVLQRGGKYNPKKLFGITEADAFRAQAMYAAMNGLEARDCLVPVICGHSSQTAVPLLSQATPRHPINEHDTKNFIENFRLAGYDESKNELGHSLATAYAVLSFTRSIMRAFEFKATKADPFLHAFVENNDFGTNFFAGRVRLTPDGVGEMVRYPNISPYECEILQSSLKQLRKETTEGKHILGQLYLD